MIAAIAMVRDEDDIVGQVICQMFRQGIDRMWVADNMSGDKTRPILDELAAEYPIKIVDDPEPGYYQSDKMSALARVACAHGADWIVPFDADEWWYGLGGTIAEMLDGLDADVVKAFGFDHVPQMTDTADTDPTRRIGNRRAHTQTFPKVVFRAHPDAYLHMGNHDVERPGQRINGLLEYRHFGYRTLEQMIRKVRQGKAAYEASTVHETHGAHWRRLGALPDDQLEAEWQQLLAEPGLIWDPAPR